MDWNRTHYVGVKGVHVTEAGTYSMDGEGRYEIPRDRVFYRQVLP